MANPRRILRLQQLILEAVAKTLQREIHDPRIGMVSVTRVKLAPDLSTATIGWSSLGEDSQVRTTERGLEDATPLIQRRVAESLSTRVTPRIHFRHDASLERAQELEEIFQKIRDEKDAHDEGGEDETSAENGASSEAADPQH